MKKYILVRFLRSCISIFMVTTIAYLLIFSLVPRYRIFQADQLWAKLNSKPDTLKAYEFNKYEELGYLRYKEQQEFCRVKFASGSDEYFDCMNPLSDSFAAIRKEYESKGWVFGVYASSNTAYASKEISILERVTSFYANMFVIDLPNKIKDDNNPTLDRKVYFGSDWSGRPALLCSGCDYKYLVYLDGTFPFIHQNFITLNFGTSYPTFGGLPVLQVMTQSQGRAVQKEIKFPTGVTLNSSLDEYSCTYKATLDRLDKTKFIDNYADCLTIRKDPSMMGVSFTMGIIALIFSYFISIPLGIYMSSRKGKLIDKAGMAYIVFVIAVPSLAYIFLFRYLGSTLFGLPDTFPLQGAGSIASWVLPIISLALPEVAGLLMWVRRYMVDQTTAEYVKFARSKGLSQSEIFYKHILRNAIIPIAHGLPGSIIGAIGGAIITERIYAIPGMGKMLPDAINAFNNNVVIALTFIFTALSILSVMLGDILITYLDPRISLHEKGGRK
jgi:oligopeptide transport system permease protein